MNAAPHASRIVIDACPLCGATKWSLHCGAASRSRGGEGTSGRPLDGEDSSEAEWVRCQCGLVFKHREAIDAVDAHGDGDAAHAGHYDSRYFGRYARRRRRRVRKARRQILDALEFAPQGRLLDVGCSLGYTMEAARSLGLEACGVDVSAVAVEECRRRGLEARAGTLEQLPCEDGSIAVAVLKHVFEHTPAPRAALGELRRVLIKDGAVFLAVPNLGYFKAARSPQTSRFFRGEAGRAHFVYYTPATLARLLESEGFVVCSVHPLLRHRRAGPLRRLLEAAQAPLRAPFRALVDVLGLRKEFWLVAVRM